MTDVADSSGASLGIQVHEEHEENNPYHAHVDFSNASLVSARVCLGCGSYVVGDLLVRHQKFHDEVREALVRASGSDLATPDEPPLF